LHFAILSLSYLPSSKATIKWISQKLKVPANQVEPAFRRLERLGLVEIRGTKFYQASKPLTTSSDIPSAAIKSNHRQNLEKALKKLDDVPVQDREYSSITFPMHIKDMKRAKAMINEFKQKLYRELKCEDPTDVFTLSMQLFPLTEPSAVDGPSIEKENQ
jgi:uncharacterized protein (TIGR02147 family)